MLSVIIVSYQKIDILRDCLNSIKKFNDIGGELEVIVSDNSNDMLLYETIKSEYGWIKIIKNENRGFGAGNNRGYEISKGEYLLFLNPDTILVEPIFAYAINKFERDKNLALFGVKLLKRDLSKNASFFTLDSSGILSSLSLKFHRAVNWYRDGKMFISGADLFVRRKSFEQSGLFDENLFMYKEEPDLIKRIKIYSEAKETKFFSDKGIIHLEGATEEKSFGQKLKSIQRLFDSDLYYSEKWSINLKKVYKQKLRQQRLKRFICLCLLKKKSAKQSREIINIYKDNLKIIAGKQ